MQTATSGPSVCMPTPGMPGHLPRCPCVELPARVLFGQLDGRHIAEARQELRIVDERVPPMTRVPVRQEIAQHGPQGSWKWPPYGTARMSTTVIDRPSGRQYSRSSPSAAPTSALPNGESSEQISTSG